MTEDYLFKNTLVHKINNKEKGFSLANCSHYVLGEIYCFIRHKALMSHES